MGMVALVSHVDVLSPSTTRAGSTWLLFIVVMRGHGEGAGGIHSTAATGWFSAMDCARELFQPGDWAVSAPASWGPSFGSLGGNR